jgi:hypothetical protein
MATYTVVKVRKEISSDGTHQHLEGVCTDAGTHFSRQKVVNSINAGDTWRTSAGGFSAEIEVLKFCPAPKCLASPYIKTRPDSSKKDNLENLDPC